MKKSRLVKAIILTMSVLSVSSIAQTWVAWGSPYNLIANISNGNNTNGNVLVAGNRFTTANDSAVLFLGNQSQYIKSTFGGGIRIGTFAAANAIQLQENTGNVGIGTTNPTVKLDVRGAIATDGNTGNNGGVKWIVVKALLPANQYTVTVSYPGGRSIARTSIVGIAPCFYDYINNWTTIGVSTTAVQVSAISDTQVRLGGGIPGDGHSYISAVIYYQ